MGGACCGCDVYVSKTEQTNQQKANYSPLATNDGDTAGALGGDTSKGAQSISKEDTPIEQTQDWKDYKKLMQMVFYTFAGYQPWAKLSVFWNMNTTYDRNGLYGLRRTVGLYMFQKDLQSFLEIVNIEDAVEDVFRVIDATDVQDGKVTMNEWMDYFTNKDINPGVFKIKEHIEDQTSWELLKKALQIFQEMDEDNSGKLEYGEFTKFGQFIGLNDEETELLFTSMDQNETGSIDIVELFGWFKQRLYGQRQRLTTTRQATLSMDQAELSRLESLRTPRTAAVIEVDEDSPSP